MKTFEFIDQIYRFLKDEISLRELEEWMVSNLRSLLKDNPGLVASVELALAEYSDGIRDLNGVKRYLYSSLEEFNTIFISCPQTNEEIKTFSASSYYHDTLSLGTVYDRMNQIEFHEIKI